MIRPSKLLLTLVCGTALCLGSAAPSEAGLIPYIYDAIFGPVGSQQAYYAGYRGTSYYGGGYSGYAQYGPGPGIYPASQCGPGGCGVQSNYGPSADCCNTCGYGGGYDVGYGYGGCANGQCGYGGCDNGQCGVGGCASGQCGLNYAPVDPNAKIDPQPEGSVPKTYEEPTPPGPSTDEEGFRPRVEPGVGPSSSNTRRPADMPEETDIDVPAKPVPGRNDPAPEDVNGADSHGPALDLDGKVTWRPAPERVRMSLRSNYTSAKIVRKPTGPRTEWISDPAEQSIAKK